MPAPTKAAPRSLLDALAGWLRQGMRARPPADAFLRMRETYGERLRRWPLAAPAPSSGGRTAVLVTPWFSTPVPFFSVELAMMLRRAGRPVSLLLDFTDVVGNSPAPAHEAALLEFAQGLGADFPIVRTETAEPQPRPADDAEAARLVAANAVRVTWGESKVSEFFAAHPEAQARLRAHLGRVRGLLAREKFDALLLPGGLYGLSGVYVAAAREAGLRFTTYDCGTGSLRLTQNGVAAHLEDIHAAQVRLETESTPAELERAQALAREEISLRLERKDSRQFQLSEATGQITAPVDVLVPLNVVWDSAALDRQHAFKSYQHWLSAVGAWAVGHPEVAVAVRQHPRERVLPWKSTDDPGALVAQYAAEAPRLRFIPASEPVSTYDLLQRAKVVLPHTSTVGVEATIYGRPVVLSARCYYDSFGFCRRADSPAEYFRIVEEALAGQHVPTPEQRERALLNYYLTQCCSWLRTDFTALPEDFAQWVDRSPEELWSSPELADLRTALLAGEILSLVRHRRLIGLPS